jgi:hypothetical protein
MTQNNTIVTLHHDDEESGSEQLAAYGELHGDNAFDLHRVAPHAIQCQVGLHELTIFSHKLLEHGIWHHIDGSAAIDMHPRNWPLVNVTLNVQGLQILAQLLRLLEHDLLGTKA